MRKQLKLLLLVAMIAVMFTMAMIVSSAAFNVNGTDYATFTEAYAAVADGGTITMTSDMSVTGSTKLLDKDFTVDGAKADGGKYKLTFGTNKALTTGVTAPISVVFKNMDVEVTSAVSSYIGTFGGAVNAGTEFKFDNCNIDHNGTLMFTGRGIIQTFHNCTVTTEKLLMKGANSSSKGYCTLKVTGNTTITSSAFLASTEGGGNGVRVIIGTKGATDNVTITALGLASDKGSATNTAASQAVSAIYSGNITITGDAAFEYTQGKVQIHGGTLNLGEASLGTYAELTLAEDKSNIIINIYSDNTEAQAFFATEQWTGATINVITSTGPVEPENPVAEGYLKGNRVIGYATLAEALSAVADAEIDTIVLLQDLEIKTSIDVSGLTLTIDGNGKTITSEAANYFTATSAFNVTIKNATMHVKKPAEEGANGGRGGLIRVTSNIVAGSAFLFEGCDIYTYGNRVIDASNVSATLHNTDLWTPGTFMSFDKVANATNTLTITGNSTITLYTHTQNDPNGYGSALIGTQSAASYGATATANLIIGSAEGGDNVTFDLAAGKSLVNWISNVNITIYSGTFKATAEGAVLNATGDAALSADSSVTIYAATFELAGGATLFGGSYTVDHIACEIENAGDITFKLGAGTAETAAAFFATDFWVVDAMAHFYITGWNATEGATAHEFSSNWSGTLAEYLAAFCKAVTPDSVYGGYIDASEFPYFITAEMAEAEGYDEGLINFFIAEGIEVGGAPTFAPFTIVNGATVTLTDWVLTYAGTVGTVTNGKLVLNNCQITGTEAGAPLFLVNGDNSALEVVGGVYDLAGLENTNVFQIGEADVAYENVTASFNGVTIWTAASTSQVGIYAYAISSLTVKDCLISPYKGIVKGDIHSMPETFTGNVNTVGIRTFAAVATITGTEIHGGGSAGAIYVLAGEVTITDVVTYCFRGVSVRPGAVANVTSSTFTSAPFNTNFYGLEANGGTINVYSATFLNRMDIPGGAKHNNYASMAVTAEGGVINVLRGTYECAAINGEGDDNQPALIKITVAGGKVIVAKGVTLTFSGHDGYVFELVEGAIVEVNGATINATGTNAAVVTGAGTATFTDCRINVTVAQAGVLFAAGALEGNTIVVAPEGTKVTAEFELGAYAQNVKYAGVALKLWVKSVGFINDAEVGASVYVDTANAETSGLRFEVEISAQTLAALIEKYGEPVKYYTLIAPMDYVAKAGGVFTKDALDAAIDGTAYVAIEAINSFYQDENGVSYSGTLVSLNSNTRLYAAIPMIEFADATVYGEFNSADNARSAEQVALAIIADTDSEYYNGWTPEQVAIVDKYAGKTEQ